MAAFNHDAYKRPNNVRDTKDLAALARGMMQLDRCPGGRYNVKVCVCMHCGIDYTDPDNDGFCGQPVEDDGYTPFDATVARRVMRESEDKFKETD